MQKQSFAVAPNCLGSVLLNNTVFLDLLFNSGLQVSWIALVVQLPDVCVCVCACVPTVLQA